MNHSSKHPDEGSKYTHDTPERETTIKISDAIKTTLSKTETPISQGSKGLSQEAEILANRSTEAKILTLEIWFPKYDDYETGSNIYLAARKSIKANILPEKAIKDILHTFFTTSPQGTREMNNLIDNLDNPQEVPEDLTGKLEYIWKRLLNNL